MQTTNCTCEKGSTNHMQIETAKEIKLLGITTPDSEINNIIVN
jgi:hypothetical protein